MKATTITGIALVVISIVTGAASIAVAGFALGFIWEFVRVLRG